MHQNLNYQIPVNNIYTTINSNIIIDEDFLREKPFYNRPSELLPAIRNKGMPKKTYNASIIPNHYLFPRKRNQNPPSNNNPPQPPQPPKPPKPPVNKEEMKKKLDKKITKDAEDMLKRQDEMRNKNNEQIKTQNQQIKKQEEIDKEKNNKLNQKNKNISKIVELEKKEEKEEKDEKEEATEN